MAANLNGIDQDFYRRFNLARDEVKRTLGVTIGIVSAVRTRAEQQYLYDLYRAGKGNLAAKPGTSLHERGLAIDMEPNSTSAIRQVFWKYGLHFPVRGEPWHVEPLKARGGVMPPLPQEDEDDMPLNDADKEWLDKTIERHVRFWAKEQIIPHINGTGDSIVKRVSEGFLAALINAVSQIKEALK